MFRALRVVGRLLWALGHVLAGLWTIHRQFPHNTPDQRRAHVRRWSRRMLDILGVELRVAGEPPQSGPLLLVANHISWLDILVLNAAQPSRFVSKADVRHWPVLGALITGAGTLYIERERRRDAMRVVHHMAEALRADDLLTVFPEGTTGDGMELLPFHANLLQAAIVTQTPVLPVALSFIDRDSGARSDAPTYIGDTTLLASMWRTVGDGRVRAVVCYGEPEHAGGMDRRAWAHLLRQRVARLRDETSL